METIKIYENYTNVLMELNELQVAYRNLNRGESADEREVLQQRIQNCRTKLNAITEKLINENPFLKGKTAGVSAMDE